MRSKAPARHYTSHANLAAVGIELSRLQRIDAKAAASTTVAGCFHAVTSSTL